MGVIFKNIYSSHDRGAVSIIESEGENNCTSLETDHDEKMATHEGGKAGVGGTRGQRERERQQYDNLLKQQRFP